MSTPAHRQTSFRSCLSARQYARRTLVGLAAGVALAAAGLCLNGCAKPLLSPSEGRSPFDRYDVLRQQYAPQYIENEYGRRQPNLRGRLSNKD